MNYLDVGLQAKPPCCDLSSRVAIDTYDRITT